MSGAFPLTLSARTAGNSTDEEVAEFISYLIKVTAITTASNAIQCSIATFFFYYCFLHFYQEVEYIWSRPWTHGKVIYIMTRYVAVIFFMLMIISLLPFGWNEAGKNAGNMESRLEKGECFGGYLYVISGSIVFLLAQTIQAIQVYAIYKKKKSIILLSVILPIASAASMQLFGLIYNCIGASCQKAIAIPYEVVIPCAMASSQVTFFGWLSTSVVQLVFLSLILWKTRQSKRVGGEYSIVQEKEPYARDIIGHLARDSKKYFVWISIVCFVGVCLNVILIIDNTVIVKLHSKPVAMLIPAALGNTFLTLAIAILAILAPSLLTRLRMEYYDPVGAQTDKEQLSWNVAVPTGSMSVNLGAPRCEGSGSIQYSMIEDQEMEND